jgi:hypothetical protein
MGTSIEAFQLALADSDVFRLAEIADFRDGNVQLLRDCKRAAAGQADFPILFVGFFHDRFIQFIHFGTSCFGYAAQNISLSEKKETAAKPFPDSARTTLFS